MDWRFERFPISLLAELQKCFWGGGVLQRCRPVAGAPEDRAGKDQGENRPRELWGSFPKSRSQDRFNRLLSRMSVVASVTFTFDGTKKEFERLYAAIADIDLDIAAYSKGTTGVVEFAVADFAAFKRQVANKSAQLGMDLIVLDYLASE